MKRVFILTIIFFLALASSSSLAIDKVDKEEIENLLSEAYMIEGDYERASEQYREILKNDPKNIKTRVMLADMLSWQNKYDEAVLEYKKALEIEPGNMEIKQKLADVLSWDKKYQEALELYDEILKEKEDPKIMLQKARILGWAKEYDKSAKVYKKILDTTYDRQVELEMKAKLSYWNSRAKGTIQYYDELIQNDPQNVEAMFDLSQAYSYQSMWKEAIDEYKKILMVSPNHFRAEEGLQKAELISAQICLESGYEFFEADSPDRANDIKKHTLFNKISFPVNYNFRIEADYNLTSRSFSDFGDVSENEGGLKLAYVENPDWQVDGFYDFIIYNKDIDTIHTFGGGINLRILDAGVFRFSHERERLENSSTVIRGSYYRDNFKERVDLDINRRLRLGLDYLFSNYSDDNYKNEAGLDALYYISFEPKRFTIKYRYFYRSFDNRVQEYFSPTSFWTNTLTFHWRHFLNKEEIFFGADDLYYDIKYDISVDSEDIASHKFSAGINRDIDKRLNLNLKASVVSSSADVYEDKSIMASIKYYF